MCVYLTFYLHRTALHWACKRNHTSIIQYLLENGADNTIMTFNGESAIDLTSSEDALNLLGCSLEERLKRCHTSRNELSFVPNYLQNPPFPYGDTSHEKGTNHTKYEDEHMAKSGPSNSCIYPHSNNDPLIVKLRVCKSSDTDFIEAEVSKLSYQALLEVCAEELEVDISSIIKIRKLPDILIRKDRDVQRMCNGQELEVVLTL